MRLYVARAKKCLPEKAPVGTFLKVAVEKSTGNFPETPVMENNKEYDFYKFVRISTKWIYLGKSKITEDEKDIYRLTESPFVEDPS